jgi:hypothetical protein
VTGRGRTCDAPRFKRALYRLSYGHVHETYGIVDFVVNDVVYATRLPFDPGSPAWGAASYVEGCWSPMLNGVTTEMCTQK